MDDFTAGFLVGCVVALLLVAMWRLLAPLRGRTDAEIIADLIEENDHLRDSRDWLHAALDKAIPVEDAAEHCGHAVEVARVIDFLGECRKPANFDPDGLNVCETHHELLTGEDGNCEDSPRVWLAVLAMLRGESEVLAA